MVMGEASGSAGIFQLAGADGGLPGIWAVSRRLFMQDMRGIQTIVRSVVRSISGDACATPSSILLTATMHLDLQELR
jgi:hypothetical protein